MSDGILLIDKPLEWTSFDVVNKVRRLAGSAGLNTTNRKRYPVGHTGTLDPLATGLLVLLLGGYTKKAPALTKLDKTYEVTMRLGEVSSTGDGEGVRTSVSARRPGQVEIVAALEHFVGDSMQRPPAFSAVKVDGRRAYDLARAGKAPELAPRPVHISRLALSAYEYPVVSFEAEVSSGTYVRSLVEDIGSRLGTGAYVSVLRRTMVGRFSVKDALTMDRLNPDTLVANLRTL